MAATVARVCLIAFWHVLVAQAQTSAPTSSPTSAPTSATSAPTSAPTSSPTSSTPAPATPAPATPAPATPAPTESVPKVRVSMTVSHINFDDLVADATLVSSFKTSMREAVADAAGPLVTPSHVSITLAKGSVIVTALITPPAGVTLEDLEASVTANATAMAAGAATKAAATPGISAVKSGDITVSTPTISTTATTAAPTPAPESSNNTASTSAGMTDGSASNAVRLASLSDFALLACALASLSFVGGSEGRRKDVA